jgi:class 3 adenylate cyclase/tetratricopeptide (TPR) repeat protein
MPIERKLAAIMFTDIAGYTETMSKSESKTLNLLEKKRSILKPLLKEYKGTFVKEIGDGTLSYFESAVNAATCAVKLQETTYDDKDMNIRVGIHIGDIVFKDGDVFGGGVNVASRLESIAPAGGVCVSKSVYDELSNQDGFDGIELGLQSLKGVGRLIEVFGLRGNKLSEPNPKEYEQNKIAVHSDDEVPSIAIIPFRNKGKEEDAFYAYGISVDLISDVSSAGLIRVASKKQIDDAGDLSQDELAKTLNVRFMVNGELWRRDDMFQLSVELYDTKDKKVVWSDRWQEKWDNLPTIKGSLSDGLLKALNTTPKVKKKVKTINTEAYEYYLKAKYKYEKRDNMEDSQVARGLLEKSIQLDDNILVAKNLLGWSYYEAGEYDAAITIYKKVVKQSQEINDRIALGVSIGHIGIIYHQKGNLNTALDHYLRSKKIREELEDKNGVTLIINDIGVIYWNKGDYDKALDCYLHSYKIQEELDYKYGMGISLMNIGIIYKEKGDYDKALDFYTQSLEIRQEIGDKTGVGYTLSNIGNILRNRGEYEKALDFTVRSIEIRKKLEDKPGMGLNLEIKGVILFEKGQYKKAIQNLKRSLKIQKQVGMNKGSVLIDTTTYIFLICKIQNEVFDVKKIKNMIIETENIEFELNYRLYELLEEKSYLDTAYNQVIEKANAMEDELKAKFLGYPIPSIIVGKWEKMK